MHILQVQYEPSIELQNLLSEDGELLTIPLKPNLNDCRKCTMVL